jgi:hypothetical protein
MMLAGYWHAPGDPRGLAAACKFRRAEWRDKITWRKPKRPAQAPAFP